MKTRINIPLEAIFWLSALALLLVFEPAANNHISICPLKLIGFDHCPGCGIGRSMSLAMKGEFSASLEYHIFGIPALGILFHRVYILLQDYFKGLWQKQSNYYQN